MKNWIIGKKNIKMDKIKQTKKSISFLENCHYEKLLKWQNKSVK